MSQQEILPLTIGDKENIVALIEHKKALECQWREAKERVEELSHKRMELTDSKIAEKMLCTVSDIRKVIYVMGKQE